jgi:ribose transport system substrate-binding protein
MRKSLRVLLPILLLSIAAAGLMANGQKERRERPIFIMVPKGVHPYYDPCYEGFRDAAAKYDVLVDMISPPKFELSLQVKIIEDLIVQKVDGIAISALDDAGLISVIDKAINAGIKVITFDAPAPSTRALAYVGTNNLQAGYEAGKRMAQLIGYSGEIAVLQGGLETLNLNLRTEGIRKAIADTASNISLVAVEDTRGDYALAVNKTEALLAMYPRLKGIFGVSAYGAPAAGIVVKELAKKNIIVAGFDDLKDTLRGISEGYIHFCIVQRTYSIGWLALELLLAATEGRPIPRNIDTGIVFVDRRNVNSYSEEIRKLVTQ